MPRPAIRTDAPISHAASLAEVVRDAETAKGIALARKAWATAEPLVQRQAALILDTDGEADETAWRDIVGVQAGEPPRLPRTLALATLASAHDADWLGSDPEDAEAVAQDVLRRLHRAGYRVEGLEPFDVYAAAWLATAGNPIDASAQMLERAETMLAAAAAGGPDAAATLDLGRGLAAAGRRRAQFERNGLILPSQVREALAGLSYADVTQEIGAPASALSTWLHGTRRVSDAAALWMHERLERGEAPQAWERSRGGRPRLNK